MSAREVDYQMMQPLVCKEHHEYGPIMACPFPGCPNGVSEDSIKCEPPGVEKQLYQRIEIPLGRGELSYAWMEDRQGLLLMLRRLLQRDSARLGLTVQSQSPASVYHYTSPAGFLGIISAGEIWLSDYAYLNDASELHHGLTLARDVFAKTAKERPAASIVLERWAQCRHDSHRVCIASFSLLGDSLSQWRGYGPIAIGFDAAHYPGFGTFRTARWGEVIYDTETQIRQLELMANLTASAWEHDARYIPDRIDDVYRDGTDYLLDVAAYFKNSGFQDERELRLVHSAPARIYAMMGEDPPPWRFRASGELIVPYLTTRDIAEKPTDRLPINDIVVGPSPLAETIRSGIQEVLHQKGYGEIPVHLSETPFRR